MSLGQQKAELHRLVDALPEEKIGSARKLLELMLSGNSGNLVKRLGLLERIIDCLPDATLAVDREGKMLVWNQTMEEVTGVK